MMREEEEQRVVATLRPPPSGFRFRPSHAQLIKYLYKKVVGEPLPMLNLIVEKTLYGPEAEEPSEIMAGRDVDEKLYFFTFFKKKLNEAIRGEDISRVAGKGTWEVQKGKSVCDPHNKSIAIGYRKPLKFVSNQIEKESWVMHEYTLTSYPSSHDHHGEWALCRIKRGYDMKKDEKVYESSLCKTADQSTFERTVEINDDNSNMPENECMRVSHTWVLPQTTYVPPFDDVGFSQKDNAFRDINAAQQDYCQSAALCPFPSFGPLNGADFSQEEIDIMQDFLVSGIADNNVVVPTLDDILCQPDAVF